MVLSLVHLDSSAKFVCHCSGLDYWFYDCNMKLLGKWEVRLIQLL